MIVKYYTYTDPITSSISKNIGWEIETTVFNKHISTVGETLTPISQENVTSTYVVKPHYSDTKEVTKEEYAALDVSGESTRAKLRRQRNETMVAVQLERETLPKPVPETIDQYLARFASVNADVADKKITPQQAMVQLLATK